MTELVDDRDPKPIRFGGQRKRGAPVLRVRRTRATSRVALGAFGGAALGIVVLVTSGQELVAIACIVFGAAVGGLIGARERDDVCATCEGPLALAVDECQKCDAPIVGTIDNIKDRAAGEELQRKARVAARKQAEAEGRAPSDDD